MRREEYNKYIRNYFINYSPESEFPYKIYVKSQHDEYYAFINSIFESLNKCETAEELIKKINIFLLISNNDRMLDDVAGQIIDHFDDEYFVEYIKAFEYNEKNKKISSIARKLYNIPFPDRKIVLFKKLVFALKIAPEDFLYKLFTKHHVYELYTDMLYGMSFNVRKRILIKIIENTTYDDYSKRILLFILNIQDGCSKKIYAFIKNKWFSQPYGENKFLKSLKSFNMNYLIDINKINNKLHEMLHIGLTNFILSDPKIFDEMCSFMQEMSLHNNFGNRYSILYYFAYSLYYKDKYKYSEHINTIYNIIQKHKYNTASQMAWHDEFVLNRYKKDLIDPLTICQR